MNNSMLAHFAAFAVMAPNISSFATTKIKTGVPGEIRTQPKIGRNVPCPCGSGKKNKNCCNK